MRPRRLLLGLVLAAGLAPSLWVRTDPPPPNVSPFAQIRPLDAGNAIAGPFALAGAWRITGESDFFGGFSALTSLPGERMLAASDGGYKLVFVRPDRRGAPALLSRFGAPYDGEKVAYDLESLTRDPDSGLIWGGYEGSNAVRRFGPDLLPQGFRAIPEMSDWGDNSGAEAFVRLPDGRFLALEESPSGRGGAHSALLFAGDPLRSPSPDRLVVEIPDGYRPVDLALGDDARLLILLRRLVISIPPDFDTAIASIDIADLEPGIRIEADLLAKLGSAFPSDNFEGMTVTNDAYGTHIWLVSDDNFMSYQSTLLLKLRWNQRQKARE